ncbi:hypothetical protein B0H13DRAFT_2371117 [Mycena leptocephala]|nr:hypothetical protein B0H13DRAFT_2371117 [Mycena leptocephala]
MSSSSRPLRTVLTPLRPDLALVPLTSRGRHPFFQQRDMQRRVPNPFPLSAETSNQRPSAPFPMELGERAVLPSLISANKVFFDECLTELRALSGAEYIPPPPSPPPQRAASVIIIDEPDTPASPPERQPVPAIPPAPPHPRPVLYTTIVHVNLKNLASGADGVAFALTLELPYNPFVSQIIAPLWSTRRVESIAGKWNPARIHVAYSRKVISVNDPSYDSVQSGFQELGRFSDVFGNQPIDGYGGVLDKVIPEVLGSAELEELRTLYSVVATAKVFSIYFFYLDHDSHSANVVAAGSRVAPPHQPTPPFSVPVAAASSAAFSPLPPASNTSLTGADRVAALVPEQAALYRAINSSTVILGSAYKKHASVRLIRQMAVQIGMIWPDAGVPKPLVPISYYVRKLQWEHNTCTKALQRLHEKLANPSTPLTAAENRAGVILHVLLDAELLDPRVPNFKVSPDSDYAKAVVCSAASVKTKAVRLMNGQEPGDD